MTDLIKTTLRLPTHLHGCISELAYRHRLSVAELLRAVLERVDLAALTSAPGAPAPLESLPKDARRLVQLMAGASSNVTQMALYAQRVGAGPETLQHFRDIGARIQALSLAAKSGQSPVDVAALEQPCQELNAALRAFHNRETDAHVRVQHGLRTLVALLSVAESRA